MVAKEAGVPASVPTMMLIQPPMWMKTFTDVLSIPGEGELAVPLQGISLVRGYLDVYLENKYWKIRLRHEGNNIPAYEIRISRNIKICGFEKERSFYQNFVKQGTLNLIISKSVLRFKCDDIKRDEEMLRKISTVFEYFFNKAEGLNASNAAEPKSSPLTVELKREESDTSNETKPSRSDLNFPSEIKINNEVMPGNRKRLFSENSLSNRIVERIPTPNRSFEPMEVGRNNTSSPFTNFITPKVTEPELNSAEYIDDLLGTNLNLTDREIQHNGLLKMTLEEEERYMNGETPMEVSTPEKGWPHKRNGVLSPSRENVLNNPSSGRNSGRRKTGCLTSEQCRRGTPSTNRRLFDCFDEDTDMISDVSPKAVTPFPSFYNKNKNNSPLWMRCKDSQSPNYGCKKVLENSTKRYSRGSLLSKRECGSSCTETSAKKLRLERDEYDEKENDDMKYGFANMRNTCYMNSILQCFLSMDCLITALKRKPHDKGIITPLLDLSACRFDAMSVYKKDILKQFKLAVQKSSDKFKIAGEQEDAHEYYLALKEGIEKELRIAHPKDKTIEKEFEIEIKSSRECKSCPKKNTNLQKFSDIGIEVPVEKFPYRIHELEELVERSIRNANVLSPNCKCGVKSNEITTKLHKLPKILVVHLRRYQATSDRIIEKIDTPIAVSSVLNMEPYCSKDINLPITEKSPNFDKRFKYHLYGIIEHHGLTTHMGHYVARVRHEDEWLYCDDEIIRTVSEDTVLNDCRKTAFLLFYIHNSCTT